MEKSVVNMGDYLTKEQHKSVLTFISLLAKLDIVKIIGCAKLLKVKVFEDQPGNVQEGVKPTAENIVIRPTEDIMRNMLDAFMALNRDQKRGILRLIKAAK